MDLDEGLDYKGMRWGGRVVKRVTPELEDALVDYVGGVVLGVLGEGGTMGS